MSGQILPKAKLLIVDDDDATTAALQRVLHRDFDLVISRSPEQALKELSASEFAIVISDQQMPGGSGIQLLTEVAQKYPKTVRVLFSGVIQVKELSAAVNKNIIHRCWLKPWDNEHLRVQLLEALKLHELIAQKDLLEKLAITDPVTGLSNHRYFHDRLFQELERAKRHSRTLSLLLLDLDHFKIYNDTYGHLEGDFLLKQMSLTFISGLRTVDSISRYGGDEFAVLLPDTSAKEALLVAERIRKLVSDAWSEARTGRLAMSVSIGVCSFPDHGSEVHELIKVCDTALYQAKHQGRNRCALAES